MNLCKNIVMTITTKLFYLLIMLNVSLNAMEEENAISSISDSCLQTSECLQEFCCDIIHERPTNSNEICSLQRQMLNTDDNGIPSVISVEQFQNTNNLQNGKGVYYWVSEESEGDVESPSNNEGIFYARPYQNGEPNPLRPHDEINANLSIRRVSFASPEVIASYSIPSSNDEEAVDCTCLTYVKNRVIKFIKRMDKKSLVENL